MWASDIDNSYGVSISPFGTFAVFRLQRGKYLAQTLWNESTAIQKGEKAQNEISVAVKGKHATVSINGTKVYEFDATPPDNGSLPGFDMTAFKTNKNDMKMTLKRFEVREVK